MVTWRKAVFLVLVSLVLGVRAQDSERVNQLFSSLPRLLSAMLGTEPYKTAYTLTDQVNPFYLWGNYDNDGKRDYVILLQERTTGGQKGLLILSSKVETFVLYDSLKIDHHSLDGWINCHWVDCGKGLFRQLPSSAGRPMAGADSILLHFGGPDLVVFWDGSKLRSSPVPGE